MTQNKCEESREGKYTYDEAVELAGHGRYNHLVLLACCVISNAVALDMFAFGLILASASCDLQLGIGHIGLLASTPFAGQFAMLAVFKDLALNMIAFGLILVSASSDLQLGVGHIGLLASTQFAGLLFAFPWGYYADTRGRRRALLLSLSVGFIMAALGSLSPNWQTLFVMKLIGCSFSTASYSLTMTYLGECTGSKHRSQYMFIMNSINLFAEAITFMLALVILGLTFNIPVPWLAITYRPWRLLTFILAIPLGIGAFIMWFLYESPKFLANQGDNAKAMEVLKKIYKLNKGTTEEYQVKTLLETMEKQEKQPFWESIIQQTVPIFKPPLLWKTMQLFYLMVLCSAINNVLVMWYPTIVNSFFTSLLSGVQDDKTFCERFVGNLTTSISDSDEWTCNDTISNNTIYAGIVTGCFFTVLNLIVSSLARWRRSVLITCYMVPGICLVFMNIIKNPIASLVLFALAQGTAIGNGVVASYFVDIYPTSFRALATSLAMMTARLGSLSGINIIGQAMTINCEFTFYCVAAVAFSGVIVTLLLPSDRKSNR